MSKRPILFSAPMVLAILAGTKTQTRRVLRDQNPIDLGVFTNGSHLSRRPVFDKKANSVIGNQLVPVTCPYGQPGDRIYVKEAHAFLDVTKSALSRFPLVGGGFGPDVWNLCVEYSDGTENDTFSVEGEKPKQTRERGETRWRPSIHMPRWASRILLEITAIRVERLQDISEADADAEGIETVRVSETDFRYVDYLRADREQYPKEATFSTPIRSYASLWNSINGRDSWAANPWVWAIEFKRVTP